MSRSSLDVESYEIGDSRPEQAYKTEEFAKILLETVKISQKNKKLRSRSQKLHSEPTEYGKFDTELETPQKKAGLSSKLQIPPEPIYEVTEEGSEHVLDGGSLILWFIISSSTRKNMIPESQFIEFSKTKKENMKEIMKRHEDLFNFGKMFCNEGNYREAISYFSKAKSLVFRSEKYRLWKSMAKLKTVSESVNHTTKDRSPCCYSSTSSSKHTRLEKLVKKLLPLYEKTEALWFLMEISLLNHLTLGIEIEPARFYAAKIKKINFFYGLLAWTRIMQKESNPDAPFLLFQLISEYPKSPEPYYILWEHYYFKKQYDRCKEIAIEAFLKISPEDFEAFHIIFCLQLSKSYYFTGEFTNCTGLLYKKYSEYPKHPVFLYTLCKFCVLSDDFSVSGIAKGNLRELLRLCDESRKGSIYYYLSKAYWHTRQFPQAFKYAYKALQLLSSKKHKKRAEMEKRLLELQPFMKKIQTVQEKLKNRDLHNVLKECQEISEVHRPSGDLLKAEMLFIQGQKNEAISLLKTMISSSRLETSAYFKLIEYDQLNTESIFKGLLTRAKNSQIPTQIWVKANLLYSKFMFKSSHYNKSFYILRVLAKILPPLPDLSLPYCNYLQQAENLQELANAVVEIEADLLPRDKNLAYLNVREMTLRISEDAPMPKVTTGKRLKTFERKKEKVFASLADEIHMESGVEEENGLQDGGINEFCVCSKSKFLYYIAKFAIKSRRNKAEGVLAIKDYMELLRLEQTPEKYLLLYKKAEKLLMALNTMDP